MRAAQRRIRLSAKARGAMAGEGGGGLTYRWRGGGEGVTDVGLGGRDKPLGRGGGGLIDR